jgi:hypothetical protein
MRAIPLMESAIKGCRKKVRRLMAGQEIPGFYLGSGPRRCAQVVERRAGPQGADQVRPAEGRRCDRRRSSSTPTQIEKLASRTRWWPKVAPLIDQPPGGPKVCQVGDDRNATYKIART